MGDTTVETSFEVKRKKALDKAIEICQNPSLLQGFVEVPKYPPVMEVEDGDFLVGVWVRIPKGMLHGEYI